MVGSPVALQHNKRAGEIPARYPVGGLGYNQDLPLVYFTILSREIGLS